MPESTAPRSPRTPRDNSRRRTIAIGAGVVTAALLLGVFSYTATKPSSPSAADGGPVAEVSAEPDAGVYPELEKLARREAGDPLAAGAADAPVVLVEYSDFRCPFCGKFARDTEPELIEKYVDDGTLRIEWRNFPIFGAESEDAARAAWAAGQQGRFWEFHELAFAEGSKEKGFGDDRIKALAKEAGVPDLARFEQDRDSEAAHKALSRDREEGYALGATSTPSFLINGRPIAGAQPLETFEQAIDQALAAKTAEAKSGEDGAGSGEGGKAPQGGDR